MKASKLVVTLFLGLGLSACNLAKLEGSGNIIEERREIEGVDRVSVDGPSEVYITQGNQESLLVEADDNIIQFIRTEVRGGRLFVSIDSLPTKRIVPSQPVRINVKLKELVGLELTGSGLLDAQSVETDFTAVNLNGSGKIIIRSLNAGFVHVEVLGSGEIDLDGVAEEQEVFITGAGTYRGGDLRCERSHIELSGSGDALIWATREINASLSGSGSLKYYGRPPEVIIRNSGTGEVKGLGNRQY